MVPQPNQEMDINITSSLGGTFSVTEIGAGEAVAEVEYLVVAGGGGGGGGGEQGGDDRHAGGGGAGGFRTASEFPVSTSPGSYTITIGAVRGTGNDGTLSKWRKLWK